MARLALQAFDVVVPFPFTNRNAAKRRPALVITHADFNAGIAHSLLAMITSAKQSSWPGDLPIADLQAAGLTHPCCARLKLFTLDQRLVLQRIGNLAATDQKELRSTWKTLLAI